MKYKVYPTKRPAVQDLEKQQAEGKPVRLWGRDVSDACGAKEFYVSPMDEVYNIIYRPSGEESPALVPHSLRSEYEWLDENVCFGVDFDAGLEDDERFTEDYDCTPDILQIIDSINKFNSAELGIQTTRLNWIVLKSGYNKKKRKHSYHLIQVGYFFKNVSALKEYALAINRFEVVPGLDMSLYGRRCLRTMGCVKKGDPKSRLLRHEPLEGTRGPQNYPCNEDFWKATLMSHVEGYELIEIPKAWTEMQTTKKQLKDKNPEIVDAAIHVRMEHGEKPELKTVVKLMECLKSSRADDYEAWRDIGFSLGSFASPQNDKLLFQLFDKFSKMSHKYDKNEVKAQWHLSKDQSSRDKKITVGTLFFSAKQDKLTEYQWIIRTCHIPYILLRDSMPDWDSFARIESESQDLFVYDEYSERYCKEVDLTRTSAGQLLVANCGTGKSGAVIDLIKKNPEARILKVLPRISCTEDDLKRMQDAGIRDWIAYLEDRKEFDTSHHNKFTTSPESCWKIQRNQTYDVVILDEPEAILDQLDSFKTMQGKLPECAEAFTSILLKAKKILLCDAMPSKRLLRFLETVFKGTGKQFLINRNTFEHLKRKAIHLVPDQKLTSQNLAAYHDEIIKDILADMREKRRVVIFAATKRFGDRLHAAVVAAGLADPSKYSYHSSDNINNINKDLKNLAEAWDCKFSISYTPVLTVGSSFDKPNYDRLYAILSNKSVNVRNSVQACQRVRQLKENLMIFFIDDTIERTCYLTEDAQIAHTEWRQEHLHQEFDNVMQKHRSISCSRILEMQREAGSPEDFEFMMISEAERLNDSPILRTPEAIHQNRILTGLENDIAYAHFTGLFYALAEHVGYKHISRKTLTLPKDVVVKKQDDQKPLISYEDMPLISYSDAAKIESNLSDATEEDKWMLKKYKFCQYIVGKKAVLEEHQALIFNTYTVDPRRAQWLFAAHQTDRKTVLKALRGDIAKLPYSEYTSVNGVVQARCAEMFALLGFRHGHDTDTTMSRERLERISDDLLPLLKTIRHLLGKESRPSRAKTTETENKVTVNQIIGSVNVILTTWCGTSLQNSLKDSRETKKGSTVRSGKYKIEYCDDFAKVLYTCGLIAS